MTFNDDSDISGGRVTRRSGGGRTGAIVGGGGSILLVIAVAVISQLTGVDLTGLVSGGTIDAGTSQGTGTETDLSAECRTGAQANESDDCRIQGAAASLETYWAGQVNGYQGPAGIVLFSGSTSSGCGMATTDVGPFYCPADQTIYVDTAFYDQIRQQFGDDLGSLAQLYIIGHEWGHHIQNLVGIMDGKDLQRTGATSDSVRLELQADCFAGAWIGDQATTLDENGVPYLEPPTDAEIQDALGAAATVGDDTIQEAVQGSAHPESFTHGTSEQRQRWFMTGYQGSPGSCDTFAVSGSQL